MINAWCVKKNELVEAYTYDEILEYGREQCVTLIDDIPLDFYFKGRLIKVSDYEGKGFVIPTLEGNMNFTKDDMLIFAMSGEMYPCNIDVFEKEYIKYE